MSGSSSVMRNQIFLLLFLAEGPLLVHRADLVVHARSMERDQILSTQPVDGEKQLRPTEIWPSDDEVFHHEYIISLKHVQNGLLSIQIPCDHALFLLFPLRPLPYAPTRSIAHRDPPSSPGFTTRAMARKLNR